MARYLTSGLAGVPAQWSPGGGFLDPQSGASLYAPTDEQGRPLKWNSGLGDWMNADGSPLHAPRVANSGPANIPGSFGGAAGSGLKAGAMLGADGKPLTPGNPFYTISNVKNPAINDTNAKLLSGLNKVVDTGVKDYTDYLTGQFPSQEANAKQESGALDYLYNPGGQAAKTTSELANLRSSTSALQKLNQDRALSYAKGMDAASGARNPRPFSASATQREFLRASNEANIPLEVQFANIERNWDQMDNAQKLAYLGKRNESLTNLAKLKAAPVMAEQANLATNAGLLGPISSLDLAQNFYGLGGDPSQIGGNSLFIPNYGAQPLGGVPNLPNLYTPQYNPAAIPRRAPQFPQGQVPLPGGGTFVPVDYSGGMIDFPSTARPQYVSGSRIPNGMTWEQYYNGGIPPSSPFDSAPLLYDPSLYE